MFDWIMLTLGAVFLIFALAEVLVRRVVLKKKESHIYQFLAKSVAKMADDASEDETISILGEHVDKLEKTNRDK
jgi:hypothetical protein